MSNSKLHAVLSDLHIPFSSSTAVKMAVDFIRNEKPGTVHLLGDIGDYFSISRYDKDPMRRLNLQEELDAIRDWLTELPGTPRRRRRSSIRKGTTNFGFESISAAKRKHSRDFAPYRSKNCSISTNSKSTGNRKIDRIASVRCSLRTVNSSRSGAAKRPGSIMRNMAAASSTAILTGSARFITRISWTRSPDGRTAVSVP